MSERLAQALVAGAGLDHAPGDARLIETHISWIVLTGAFAYKLKKPVDLGFVDFTSLEKRRFYCEEELRLNRRTAPSIDLAVVPISGSESEPLIGDESAPIDYAVRMRRFDPDQTLDHVAARGELHLPLVLSLADAVAALHGAAECAGPDTVYGRAAAVQQQSDDNFRELGERLSDNRDRARLAALDAWTGERFETIEEVIETRRAAGRVRECHGDLHLGNILLKDGRCVLFDCIEFNAALRWTDTAADIAFTMMDIAHSVDRALANLLYNEYLQCTGDYGSVAIIDYFLVYRAMVRAKVDAIRCGQSGDEAMLENCRSHLELAQSCTQRLAPRLIILCGLSGSGKTTLGRHIAAELDAVHLRSDVERKRLFGLGMRESSAASGLDIYTSDASRRTFDRLFELAGEVLDRGVAVAVDATFIEASLRERFRELALQRRVPWHIVHCQVDRDEAHRRLAARSGDASEAGIAQYEEQRRRFEKFSTAEAARVVALDTTREDALQGALQTLRDAVE